MSPMGRMTLTKLAMHGWCKVNNIMMWLTRFHFLSPSMLVAHLNKCCMETCANTKLLFVLHVLISPREILFNIVGHGMDPIMEVLLSWLRTLHIYTFMTMSPMMKSQMKMTLKNHGLSTWVGFWHWMVPPPMLRGRRITTNLRFQMPPLGLSKLTWHTHFALGITSTSILICLSCLLGHT
jgi:hypothetical protein